MVELNLRDKARVVFDGRDFSFGGILLGEYWRWWTGVWGISIHMGERWGY